jgi:hypothetical protein
LNVSKYFLRAPVKHVSLERELSSGCDPSPGVGQLQHLFVSLDASPEANPQIICLDLCFKLEKFKFFSISTSKYEYKN